MITASCQKQIGGRERPGRDGPGRGPRAGRCSCARIPLQACAGRSGFRATSRSPTALDAGRDGRRRELDQRPARGRGRARHRGGAARLGRRARTGPDGVWRVRGVGVGGLAEPDRQLDLGNSGTGARLLLGLLAGHPFTSFLTGDASLRARPMAPGDRAACPDGRPVPRAQRRPAAARDHRHAPSSCRSATRCRSPRPR